MPAVSSLLRARKRRLLDPAEEVRRHGTATIVIGASAALALCIGIALAMNRVATRDERARKARWKARRQLLKHPELTSPKPRSFVVELLQKGVSAAAAATLAALAKHYVARALTAPPVRG